MSEILVIGHKNPDTDAICSAIGYAEYKRRTGTPEAIAARCGDINDRIDFVLKKFGVEPPKFVPDVSPRVRDVMAANVVSILPDVTVGEAMGMMEDRGIRVLPILDEAKRCKGLLSLFKVAKFFFPAPNRVFDSRRVAATVRNLARTLGAKMLFAVDPDLHEELILMIAAMKQESFAKRLPQYPPEKIVVVVGDRLGVQEIAVRGRVRVLIVTGGLDIEPAILDLARRNEVSVLLSPHDSATTSMLCRAAISVKYMMNEQFLSFRDDELLCDAERLAVASQFQAFPVVGDHDEVVGILSKTDFLKRVDRQLILVDHNELSQAVNGADQMPILEVIDHHRINTFSTTAPILFRNEPVGSTSTIVADCFFREHVELPRSVAGLLLAGLVSDTLNLTSPTTTEKDALILQKLEEITGINAAEFTEQLFASGSVLISRTPEQAITTDCKEYTEQGRTFSVAQIEEIGFDQFWKRREEVTTALEDYRAKNKYFFSCLLVTDVVRQTSVLVVAGDAAFLRRIDYPEIGMGLYELDGVVSRKKQLMPYLTHCLKQL
jgi:manganese-dependent inorganic pyrophosphatase